MAVSARSTRRSQTALGVEEEHACGDDLFPFSQADADLHAIGQLRTEDDGARLELTAGRYEDVLLKPRIDNCIAWHREDVLSSRLENRRAIQAGP
jgi:hypothetical protein